MTYQVLSVFDSKAKVFFEPKMFRSKEEALRAFKDMSNDKSLELGKHPEDYSLMYLGTYDDGLGKFDSLNVPENLGLAASFVELRSDSKPMVVEGFDR